MLMVLSPSKGQEFDHPAPPFAHTIPDHLEQSVRLIGELKKLTQPDLRQLMDISDKIADLNVKRYRAFSVPFTPENARQALFAFKGDVYSRIPADSYSRKDLAYAQDHLRILSGLYGTLRPLDLIQPYRLEMKTRLKTTAGDNLYDFWGERITQSLNAAMAALEETPVLVNLASTEYFKAIKPKKLTGRLLTLHFKEIKNGKSKVIAIFAKRARGMMAHFMIKNRIKNPEEIKQFDTAGYRFSTGDSDADNWRFVRPQPS
ncbi:MAG: peroxide stress protein YaaA [Deltaproteobacteria bacterium]|nr:MAG: peroxide stress protein YaaA [Deltaproteobacteria bacterium]